MEETRIESDDLLVEMSTDEEKSDVDPTSIEALIELTGAASTLSLNVKNPSEKRSLFDRFSGIVYSLTASALFTCSTFSIKQLDVDLLDALIFRFFLQAATFFLFLRWKNYRIFGEQTQEIVLQLFCCVAGGLTLFLYFFAIRYIDLSDGTTLFYTRVVWTLILSLIFCGERPSFVAIFSLPLTVFGVVLVAQPSFLFSTSQIELDSTRSTGIFFAISGAIVSSCNVLLFKRLISTSKQIKPSVLNFHYSVAVSVLLVFYQVYKYFSDQFTLNWQIVFSWPYISSSIICLAMIVVNVLQQKAIKREHPALFSLLGSADIVFALILQNTFTQKRSNYIALLGSAIVIFSVLIIGFSKIFEEQNKQDFQQNQTKNSENEEV